MHKALMSLVDFTAKLSIIKSHRLQWTTSHITVQIRHFWSLKHLLANPPPGFLIWSFHHRTLDLRSLSFFSPFVSSMLNPTPYSVPQT